MGNGIGKLGICFTGGSRRRRDKVTTSYSSNPLDEGLGHSFCYIPPPKANFSDDPTTTQATSAAVFRTISGASISANASTPLSTALVDIGPYSNTGVDKASAFESSHLFSSIPLQPIPRSSVSSVRSGPIPRVSGPGSGPIERGFLSGPIERSFTSGPLENQYDQFQRYKPKAKRWAYVNSLKKVISKSLWGSSELSWPERPEKHNHNKHNNNNNSSSNHNNYYYGVAFSGTNSNTTSNSNTLSSQASLFDDDYDDNNESFRSQNVQWAQGKAGEDRVHIVISEEHGWVFVGIYDGFNGPDATDFLLNNLYSNVCKELKGLLWNDKLESSKNSISESILSSCDINSSKEELGWKLRAKLNKFGSDGVDNHSDVLKALSEGLRKTEESYLEIADMMVMENPELALMGSCVLVMLMKGEDVYLMNVGDSRAVLARKIESDRWTGKLQEELEHTDDLELFDGDEFCSLQTLTSCQLTMDHCTSIKKEVQRIKREHPDDVFAVTNDRVKGSLKVTRAFGAGFLKQPKWNNALLEMFRIDYVGNSPYITCSPYLYHHRLGPRDRFLILSSDGLYQYFTNEEAVSEVEVFMSTFPEGDPAQHLVEEVLFRAAKKAGLDFYELLDIPQGDRRKYHDDVSIIIISFEGRMWRSSV